MFTIFHYLKSKNKKVYSDIAKKHESGVLHVYRLARGATAKNSTDFAIVQDLIEAGIVSGFDMHW